MKPRKRSFAFRLFVAGHEPNSMAARENLARLCETHLKGRYRVEIVDVFKRGQAQKELSFTHSLASPKENSRML